MTRDLPLIQGFKMERWLIAGDWDIRLSKNLKGELVVLPVFKRVILQVTYSISTLNSSANDQSQLWWQGGWFKAINA
jgi:hypothetical protein